MKTLSLMIIAIISFLPVFAQSTAQTEIIKVWGNCGMCKKKIEKAAKSAGASTANWSEETKSLSVSFDAAKCSSMKIQEAIAKVGYDTQDLTADENAYNNLPGCCQYDRKTAVNTSSTSCCSEASCTGTTCKDKNCCKDKKCCKS
jgi:hypothetical protein